MIENYLLNDYLFDYRSVVSLKFILDKSIYSISYSTAKTAKSLANKRLKTVKKS